MNSESTATIKMVLAMLISGTIGVFVVESGESVYNVVFFRCLIGAILMGSYAYYRGFLQAVNLKELSIILLGGAAIVINWCLLFKSYEYASIGVSTVAYHTQPFFVIIFSVLLLREPISKSKFSLVPLAFLGVILVIDPFSKSISSDWLYGMALALAAAVFYAISTVIIKKISGVTTYTIVFIQLLLGTVMLAPMMEVMDSTLSIGEHWIWLLGLGALHTCVMYILMYDAFKVLPSIKIAVLAYIYPVAAVSIDYFVYNKELSGVQFLGMALIIGSGFLVNNNDFMKKMFSPKNKLTTSDQRTS